MVSMNQASRTVATVGGRTGACALILTALLIASPAEAQERKTAIGGWPPYVLGVDVETIPKANSALSECWDAREFPQDWSCLDEWYRHRSAEAL